jgi:hypothetical protein
MKKISKIILISSATILPVVASAQTFKELSEDIYMRFMPLLTNFFLTLSMLFFAWGVLNVVITEGDKKEVAKDRLVWATVALFIMVSFWGILAIVNNTFFKDGLGKGSYTVDNVYNVPKGISGTINILGK